MSSKKILVVDDEIGIREVLVDALEMEGYQVFQAGSGQEALKLLSGTSVDLVLSDVRMQNGDGIFLLKEIRRTNPDIPIVALITGFSEINTEEARGMGAKCLLSKPFKVDEILRSIKDMLESTKA